MTFTDFIKVDSGNLYFFNKHVVSFKAGDRLFACSLRQYRERLDKFYNEEYEELDEYTAGYLNVQKSFMWRFTKMRVTQAPYANTLDSIYLVFKKNADNLLNDGFLFIVFTRFTTVEVLELAQMLVFMEEFKNFLPGCYKSYVNFINWFDEVASFRFDIDVFDIGDKTYFNLLETLFEPFEMDLRGVVKHG